MSVLRHALPAQLAGLAAAALALYSGLLPAAGWALAAQALVAALCAHLLGSARWWLLIHLSFVPALALGLRLSQSLAISPHWFLLIFLALLLVYGHTHRSQVPLYLSNQATAQALARLLPTRPVAMLDIGAGIGNVLRVLANIRPDCRFTGIELALAPWLLGRMLANRQPNINWQRGDFFQYSWADFEVVYAFLSPVPMSAVWAKACAELAPGSLLVSNSFAIPGIVPEQTLLVDDRRRTHLLVYRIPAHSAALKRLK